MEPNLEKLREAYGDVQKLKTPTGHEIIIREQNGEDDDVLSNEKGVKDGSSSNRFIQGIVVWSDYTTNNKLSIDDVKDLKICDKYFIMIASRIFSLGQTLKFNYSWPKIKTPVEYEEDLGNYVWDYNLEFPDENSPDYNEHRIPPHPHGKDKTRTINLKTGKIVRYKFLDGHGERYIMNLPEDKTGINTPLKARSLELKLGDGWQTVHNFKGFKGHEMAEIRKDVIDNDPNMDELLMTEIENPDDGQITYFPIIASQDFFYPREI